MKWHGLSFWLATLGAIVGFPWCFWVIFASNRISIPSITRETAPAYWPVPAAIGALAVVSLVAGRNRPGTEAQLYRGWAIGYLVGAVLVVLLLRGD